MSKEERYEARLARKESEQQRKQSRQFKGHTVEQSWSARSY